MASPATSRQAAASSASSSSSVAGASSAAFLSLPDTTQRACSHSQAEHVRLPHLDASCWKETIKKLEPLASYYVEYIQPAKRGAIAPTTKAADKCIWRDHYVPADTPAPPVYPSATCVAYLSSVRHPSSRGKYSGKSLIQTLDSVLDPLDKAHFFQVILPYLCWLALQLPTHFPPGKHCLPLLMRGVDASVSLSAAQCATLLACQALSLFDDSRGESYPTANFDAFFTVTRAPMHGKHILVMNYLARIENPSEGIPPRFVTFHRRVVDDSVSDAIDDMAQTHAATPLTEVEYHENGVIEDALHSLQADFANKFLGGGVLFTGCVQEEIRFCLSPECIVGMIFSEVLEINESIIIIGTRQYSHYAGYGTDLKFGSNLPDDGLPCDEYNRKSNCIVAIDAIDFCHNDGSEQRGPQTQWKEEALARETLKAYVGFSFEQKHLGQRFTYDSVATGNWGCGAFGGFVPLKFLLQWFACSLSSRRLLYYSFGNPLAKSIPTFVQAMKQLEAETGKPGQGKVSVGEMYAALLAVAPKYAGIGKKDETPDGLFKDIIKKLSARGGKQKMLPPPPPDTPDVSAPPEDTPMSSSEPAASVPAASQLAPSASSAVALFSLPSAAAKMEVDDDDDPLYNGSWPLNENVGPNKEYRIAMVARI